MKYTLSILILALFYARFAHAETEPNDAPAQANALTVGGSQGGTLTGGDTDDWFALDIAQAGILTLSLGKTGGGQGNLYLKDAEKTGYPVVNEFFIPYYDAPADGWKLTQPVQAGHYYVHLSKLQDAVNYTLSATLTAPVFAEDAEPNDTSVAALPLPPNGSMSGIIRYYRPGTGYDWQDWYKMTVPQGGILSVTVQKKKDGQAKFFLRDNPDAAAPAVQEWYWSYTETPADGWKYNFPVRAGTFYFQILSNGSTPLDYQLETTLTLPVFPEDPEPNDTAVTALPLPPNGSISGTIRYYGPEKGYDWQDWYKMTVPQGGMLNITVQKKKDGQAKFFLRDSPDAAKPAVQEWYWPYYETPAEGWKFNFPVLAGTFYFQILNDAGTPLDYQIETALVPPVFPEDAEPNDSSTLALALPPNGSVSGTIRYFAAVNGFDTQDWYKMNLAQGGILNIAVQKKKDGQAWFYLRDNADAAKPPVREFYWSYSETGPDGHKYSLPLLAGAYYFQIKNDAATPLDYQIATAQATPAFPEDAEPNDSPALALPILPDDTISGNLGYYIPSKGYDQQDWYRFTLPGRGVMQLTLHKKFGGQGPLLVRKSPDESQPPLAEYYLSYGETPPAGAKWSFLAPDAGTYYFQLKSNSADYFDYQLENDFIQAPEAQFSWGLYDGTAMFVNSSLGEQNSYFWTFDDGASSAAVNPLHDFGYPANFHVCLVASNPGGADTFCRSIVVAGLKGILPTSAGNTGDATITVNGGGLDTGYVAKIMQGSTLIAASDFTGIAGKSAISVQFDLRGKPEGTYTFVVEKSGGPSYKLVNGFKIAAGTKPSVWANVSGRNRILFNTWTTYTVNYGNYGNVDARLVPVWFAISREPGLDVQFLNAYIYEPDSSIALPNTDGLYTDVDSLFGQPGAWRVYPLLLPLVPASSSQSFPVKIKTGGNLKIYAWAEKPWYQSPLNENKLECTADVLAEAPEDLGLKDKVECTKLMMSIIFERIMKDYYETQWYDPTEKEPEFFSTMVLSLRAATKICGVNSKEDREKISDWVTNILVNKFLQGTKTPAKAEINTGANCADEFKPENPQTTSLTAVSSLDPNEKTGPHGFGPENYLAPVQALSYTIQFENKATASAPAHKVEIHDVLDWKLFDVTTFRFGPITIGDSVIYPNTNGLQYVYDYKNFIPGKLTLRVFATYDLIAGVLSWYFRSLDPLTLDDIEDPDLGFLPPNIVAPQGQGSVSFSINLKKPLDDGASFVNSASIVFDANDPIVTNEHAFRCDAIPPSSAVEPLPATTPNEQFPVSWSGSDAASGVQFYHIYVSTDGGADSLWQARTTATSAVFNGAAGHSYRFYSIAADNVGNTETAPTLPDAQISITVGTDDPAAAGRISVAPNPARERLSVAFAQAVRGTFSLSRPDGTPVISEKIAGETGREFSVTGLAPGIYFWKWTAAAGITTSGKIVVLR